MFRPLIAPAVALAVAAAGVAVADPAVAQTAGPGADVVYTARKGDARVRLVRLGESPSGEELLLVDVKVECGGFEPEARLVGVVEEEGRFEVEGPATEPGTTDVIDAEFDDIDGKVRSDGAVLEIDIEVEGEDNAGPTGRCEETQSWRLEPRRAPGAARIDGAASTDADVMASNDDALFLLKRGDGTEGALLRVDPQTMTMTWTVEVNEGSAEIAAVAAGEAVWVLDPERLEVARIGALSGDVEATVPLGSATDGVSSISPLIVASPTAAWVSIDETEAVYRIDAATNALTVIGLPGRVDALAPAADGVYASVVATDGGSATLTHFGEGGDVVSSTPIEDLPSGLAADPTRVWTRSTERLGAYDPALLLVGELTRPRLATGRLSDLVLAVAPGAWTPSKLGLEAFGEGLSPEVTIPVVGAAATALVSAEDALFVLDSGYLMRISGPL